MEAPSKCPRKRGLAAVVAWFVFLITLLYLVWRRGIAKPTQLITDATAVPTALHQDSISLVVHSMLVELLLVEVSKLCLILSILSGLCSSCYCICAFRCFCCGCFSSLVASSMGARQHFSELLISTVGDFPMLFDSGLIQSTIMSVMLTLLLLLLLHMVITNIRGTD